MFKEVLDHPQKKLNLNKKKWDSILNIETSIEIKKKLSFSIFTAN